MSKPRLLDLFCGAGGAAMGYHRAGFEVVGVDIKPQPHYPFEMTEEDALKLSLDGFDAIHASPPCQAYANVTRWRGSQDDWPRLIEPVRERLRAASVPYIIENVWQTQLRDPLMLCGSWFGLKVIRHRYFETSLSLPFRLDACDHRGCLPFMHKGERAYADAMGCDWMNKTEAREAIPPAYTEWIGRQFMAHLARAA